MDKKNKKELLNIIEEQNKNLSKYKCRLHDLVESYKHLVKEKEALENTIRTLTDANKATENNDSSSKTEEFENNTDITTEKKNDVCLQMLKSSLGALTVEKSRIENELRADRKKLLQQKDELERNLVEMENKWFLEREKYENQIQELKKKVNNQQREREKEQQDHSLMLKELQNILAVERMSKEKLEDQTNELQKYSSKLSEKKISEYESCIEDLQNELKICQKKLLSSETRCETLASSVKKIHSEMDDLKLQYLSDLEAEKKRADVSEDKLKLLTIGKEKRIANLESRISELSEMLGNYDKLRQQDQVTIQHLKEKISQLQVECSAISKLSFCESKTWEYDESNSQDRSKKLDPHLSKSDFKNFEKKYAEFGNKGHKSNNLHDHCQAEIMQLRDELEQYKAKAESALKEKYNNNSAALLSDAKAGKEIKELKSKIIQLKDQLQASKSQLKVNEEYHNKVIANMEMSIEEVKIHHKQEIAQVEIAARNQLLELEHQIQKQRERTLCLLEEKEKEIGLLKSSFLSSLISREKTPNADSNEQKEIIENPSSNQEAATTLLSSSLISSKKDGHLLHYVQELARKDVEICNLRHSRIQSDSSLRKLQQNYAFMEEKYTQEIEALKSRMNLLEAAEDNKGMSIEYLKNVVLRFLKCSDPNTKQHMINAIATILHFTKNEVQEVNSFCKYAS